MAKNLVIVESPAKAKTINKYLGSDYQVLASYGHIRDLIPKTGAVDPENNFEMKYDLIEKNKKHMDAISSALKSADTLMLATDPDREGEAISWHILEHLKEKKKVKDKTVKRVCFYEITKKAVKEAIANPRDVSMDLVNAQQARRALDYLVGFNLSPLLWKKIRRGLSAGRVQSPALRLIVERELEIEAFESKEYWSIQAALDKDNSAFGAKLTEWESNKLKQFDVNNETQATDIKEYLIKQADGSLTVHKIEKKSRKRNPAAPFTTSTLQQEAARKLGFSARKTMTIAQQLYEGIKGSEGLITYMRTDSVNLSQDAVSEIRDYITSTYGAESLPDVPRVYKTKSKNAQEAHEAVRPTSTQRTPESLIGTLESDHYKLYNLIFKRTVACQMIHAVLDTVAVDFLCGDHAKFRANGSVISKPGFMRVYQESFDDKKEDDSDSKMLPTMVEGDVVKVIDITGEQHFTEPPPRFSEASLVKALEEFGIGRPSTYASIISTLQNREYALLDNKRFKPTDVGRIVNKFLTSYFTQYVDYDFTAKLEDELDEVSRGEKEWIPVLDVFWKPFVELIAKIEEDVQRSDVTQEEMDEDCPKCGKKLSKRLGRTGRFIGCTAYPECDYTRSIDASADDVQEEPEVVEGRKCPRCESTLIIRKGRFGKFVGCSSYPKCKFIESLDQPDPLDIRCPECHEGEMTPRKSRYGKIFYSCNRYPDCKYAVWNKPIKEVCPDCKWPILTVKTTKRKGTQKVCAQKNCGFEKDAPELAEPEDNSENKDG